MRTWLIASEVSISILFVISVLAACAVIQVVNRAEASKSGEGGGAVDIEQIRECELMTREDKKVDFADTAPSGVENDNFPQTDTNF